MPKQGMLNCSVWPHASFEMVQTTNHSMFFSNVYTPIFKIYQDGYNQIYHTFRNLKLGTLTNGSLGTNWWGVLLSWNEFLSPLGSIIAWWSRRDLAPGWLALRQGWGPLFSGRAERFRRKLLFVLLIDHRLRMSCSYNIIRTNWWFQA